jgi:tetratricopeptide (TPR) repeat protein
MANQFTAEGNERALALYQQALALDPDSASAWDGLARVYLNMGSTGQRAEAEANRLAREAVDKALAVEPGFAMAHARLGFIAMNNELELGAAAKHYTRALELAPGDLETLAGTSSLLQGLGRLDQAILVGRYATARDPVSALGHRVLCQNQLLAGHWDEAIASCTTALALSPGTTSAEYQIGLALLGKGEAEAALAAFQRETGDEEFRAKGVAAALYTLGRRAEFEQAFTTLRERWGAQWPSEIAQVYAWSGDADQTFAWLEKALAQKEAGLTQQFLQLFYKPVHADPRWAAFRERTGSSEAQLAAIAFEVKLPD